MRLCGQKNLNHDVKAFHPGQGDNVVRTNLNHELKELMALIIGVKAFYPVHFGQGDNVVPNPLSGGGDNISTRLSSRLTCISLVHLLGLYTIS